MIFLLKLSGVALAGGVTFKAVTSGIDDLADSSLKIGGAVLALGTAYVVAKQMKVI